MSQLGIGAMLYQLGGGTENSASDFYGKTITDASKVNEEIRLAFDDGTKIAIFDDAQSCCEYRHMTIDDDISSLIGGKLVKIELKEGPDIDDGEAHETCFLEISTDKAFVTATNHNEHNGYYGGFGLNIKKVD